MFRARDTRLNRDVAVRVLPNDLVAGADRLRRFEQEAKTLAALNHPNVLTIHDAGMPEGAPYLVLAPFSGHQTGHDLAAMPPVDVKVSIGRYHHGMGQGFAHAHEAGVGQAHREVRVFVQ